MSEVNELTDERIKTSFQLVGQVRKELGLPVGQAVPSVSTKSWEDDYGVYDANLNSIWVNPDQHEDWFYITIYLECCHAHQWETVPHSRFNLENTLFIKKSWFEKEASKVAYLSWLRSTYPEFIFKKGDLNLMVEVEEDRDEYFFKGSLHKRWNEVRYD